MAAEMYHETGQGSEKRLKDPILLAGEFSMGSLGWEQSDKTSLIPLYGSLYSQKSPDFQRENLEIRRAVNKVSDSKEKRGIWVMDRGGDRDYIFDHLLEKKLSFIARLKKTRDLIYRGGEHCVLELALSCLLPYAERIVKEEKGTAVAYFAMVYLGLRTKLKMLARHVMGAARRLFRIPEFHFYALADGICEHLFGHQQALQSFFHQWHQKNNQLSLFDP